MSKKITTGRTIRELTSVEMNQVAGGLRVKVHGVGKVRQPIPIGVIVKRGLGLGGKL